MSCPRPGQGLHAYLGRRLESLCQFRDAGGRPQGEGVLLGVAENNADLSVRVLTALHVVHAGELDDDNLDFNNTLVALFPRCAALRDAEFSVEALDHAPTTRCTDDGVWPDWAVVSLSVSKASQWREALRALKPWPLSDVLGQLREWCGAAPGCDHLRVVTCGGDPEDIVIKGANTGAHAIADCIALQEGNSGAPVVNDRGELVGMYTGSKGIWLLGRTSQHDLVRNDDERLCKQFKQVPPKPDRAIVRIECVEQKGSNAFKALVQVRHPSIDNSAQFQTVSHTVDVQHPFAENAVKFEQDLEWYFEQHMKEPFTDTVRFGDIAATIKQYGKLLFGQIAGDRDCEVHLAIKQYFYKQNGIEGIEIVGPAEFHALHWEALQDHDAVLPLSVDVPLLRRHSAVEPHLATTADPKSTMRVLLVVARPLRDRDIGYRTFARPLIEDIQGEVPIDVHVLRPGTFKALLVHLEEEMNNGRFYDVIHFDMHGALYTHEQLVASVDANALMRGVYQKQGTKDAVKVVNGKKIVRFPGEQPFLLFESGDDDDEEKGGVACAVSAHTLATTLSSFKVPVIVLSACKTSVQRAQGVGSDFAGELLEHAHARVVVGMAYSVHVEADKIMMLEMYKRLAAGDSVNTALRAGRRKVFDNKQRSAFFGYKIDLEDWLLPVVFANGDYRFRLDIATSIAIKPDIANRAHLPPHQLSDSDFIGRDLDVLAIERHLFGGNGDSNLVLVRAMGGVGKTTLLLHLARWWLRTGVIASDGHAFYFGFDQRAYHVNEIVREIGQVLYAGDGGVFERSNKREDMVVHAVAQKRHLLILDNLESVTCEFDGVPVPLSGEEQQRLLSFVRRLCDDGRSLVLLGSRADEQWLVGDGDLDALGPTVEIGGLDQAARSELAAWIARKCKISDANMHDRDTHDILRWLDGVPLAMRAVLPELARKSPAEVKAAFADGRLSEFKNESSDERQKSMAANVRYALRSIADDDMDVLDCLAPFTSVLFVEMLGEYGNQLCKAGVVDNADAATVAMKRVIEECKQRGLMSSHLRHFVRLHPALSIVLRFDVKESSAGQSIRDCFDFLYENGVAPSILGCLRSTIPKEKQSGLVYALTEFGNLTTVCVRLARQRKAFEMCLAVANAYLKHIRDFERRCQFSMSLFELSGGDSCLSNESNDEAFRMSAVSALDTHASSLLFLHRLEKAEAAYEKVLQYGRTQSNSSTYQQLGIIAERRRDFPRAKDLFGHALQCAEDAGNYYAISAALHHLGIVAHEQRKWDEARSYYQRARDAKSAANDMHSRASTLVQLGKLAVEQPEQNLEQASSFGTEALVVYEQFGDKHAIAMTLFFLGIIEEERTAYESAVAHFGRALPIFQQFGDIHQQALTHHQLGKVAQDCSNFDEAEEHYKTALQLVEGVVSDSTTAETWANRGIVAELQQRWDDAARYYREALRLFGEGEDACTVPVLFHLCTLALRQGEYFVGAQRGIKAYELLLKVSPDDANTRVAILQALCRCFVECDERATHFEGVCCETRPCSKCFFVGTT